MSLKQPIGQKRLTNIALVRYKKKGKRFEIACYKNKVVNWRAGVEKDLDEVLQTTSVFSNVSKGVLAKHEDLVDVFGTDDEEKICIRILNDGDYQVSDKERDLEFDSLFKDVASILVEKCVNPQTQRPYTISMLERALKDIHFSVDPKRGAKQQALEVLPRLKAVIPIERARMRLKTHVPKSCGPDALAAVLGMLKDAGAEVEAQDATPTQDMVVCTVDPSRFRDIHNFVQQTTGSAGQVEVVSLGVTQHGEAHASVAPAWAAASTGPSPGAQDWRPPPSTSVRADGRDGSGAQPSATTEARTVVNQRQEQQAAAVEVVYPKGPVAELPDEFESRRDRFAELDQLQPGWLVELCRRRGGSTIDAVFYSPAGDKAGSFANARRAALQAHKQAAGS